MAVGLTRCRDASQRTGRMPPRRPGRRRFLPGTAAYQLALVVRRLVRAGLNLS